MTAGDGVQLTMVLLCITWLEAPGAAPPQAWRHSHTLRQEHPRQPQPQWLGAQWYSESQMDHCSIEGDTGFHRDLGLQAGGCHHRRPLAQPLGTKMRLVASASCVTHADMKLEPRPAQVLHPLPSAVSGPPPTGSISQASLLSPAPALTPGTVRTPGWGASSRKPPWSLHATLGGGFTRRPDL